MKTPGVGSTVWVAAHVRRVTHEITMLTVEFDHAGDDGVFMPKVRDGMIRVMTAENQGTTQYLPLSSLLAVTVTGDDRV